MRLLLGMPGSGKTRAILTRAREMIRCADGGFRIVVPSATMAEHLRNTLAREGLVIQPSTIITMSALVAGFTPEADEAGGEELALIVDECLRSAPSEAFSGLTETPGLSQTVAAAIEDLSNSGCDPLQWAALGRMGVWRGRVLAEFGRLWERVEEALSSRNLVLRAQRIARAIAAIRTGAAGAVPHTVLADGFFLFSRVEIELLRALGEAADLWVTLPEWRGVEFTKAALEKGRCRVERLGHSRAKPLAGLVEATDPQGEAEEIALRILEAHREGFSWREMGVIMRSSKTYAALLERTFARAGIPARFYFGQPLSGTAIYRFLNNWIQAAVSGWEHRRTLHALQSRAHEAGRTPAAAALERAVIDRLPGEGLDSIARVAQTVPEPGTNLLRELIEAWRPFASWGVESAAPSEWAERLATLTDQASPPVPSGAMTSLELSRARTSVAAMRAIKESLASTARLLPEERMTLEQFWRVAGSVAARATLRPSDGRRDVVHVMDVYESRQWELPAVFVCGMAEGEFPRRAAVDPLLGEELRLRLQQQGFPVLRAADRDEEESFLCEIACSRATKQLTISYPAHSADGSPTVRAFFLDNLGLAPVPARRLRVVPAAPVAKAGRRSLQSPEILEAVRRSNDVFRPSWVEDFLQCPFRFFARRTLGLRENPAGPEDRLTPAVLGQVMHDAIDRWHNRIGGDLVSITAAMWRSALERYKIPQTWRTETQWLLLERSARFYAAKGAPEPGWTVRTEMELGVEIGSFRFAGRADRVDMDATGQARVHEFKFVGSASLAKRKKKMDQGLSVQAPLYALALRNQGLTPVGYSIVALRGDTRIAAFEEPEKVIAGMEQASRIAAAAAFAITQGDVRVMPADEEMCASCSFKDACRKREDRAVPELAAGRDEDV